MLSENLLSTKHFCILPWVHMMVHTTGEVMTCCRDGELAFSYGSLKESSFEEIWNGERIRKMRQQLLNDAPLPQCHNCYEEEALGIESLRQSTLKSYPDVKHLLDSTKPDGSVPTNEIPFLGLRLSNNCNLKCRTCSPGNSVGWYRDAEALSGKKYSGVMRPARTEKDLWKFLDPLLPTVRNIYFAGGEPLLQKEHFVLLEKLIANGQTNVHLTYNTNLTVLRYKNWNIIDLWKNFPHVSILASFDGVEEQSDLLRKGSRWHQIEKNYRQIKTELPELQIDIAPTVNVMNAFHLMKAIDRWIDVGMIARPGNLRINMLQFPRHFNLKILNREERLTLKSQIEGSLANLSTKVDSALYRSIEAELRPLIKDCESPIFWKTERAVFRQVTFKLDRQRKERFIEFFPEHFNILYENNTDISPAGPPGLNL